MLNYSDFYDIAVYGNENWKGSFTPKEIAQNAHDYMAEYEFSINRKEATHTIKVLYDNLNDDCKNANEEENADISYWLYELGKIVNKEEVVTKENRSEICGIIFQNGADDYELWEGFVLTENEENAIWHILSNHETEGCSVRGTRNEIAKEMA